MLVYPVLVLAFGALWPLDWAHTRLNSVSSVTGHYHGSTWAMAEKVTGDDDPEEVVVKNLKENSKSSDGWFTKLAKEWDLVDKDGKVKWDTNPYLVGLIVIVGAIVIGVAMAAAGAVGGGIKSEERNGKNKWIGPAVFTIIVAILVIPIVVMVIRDLIKK